MSRGISQSDQPVERAGDGADLFSKFDGIIALREGLLASGQEDPFNLVMERFSRRPGRSATGARRYCSAPTITWA